MPSSPLALLLPLWTLDRMATSDAAREEIFLDLLSTRRKRLLSTRYYIKELIYALILQLGPHNFFYFFFFTSFPLPSSVDVMRKGSPSIVIAVDQHPGVTVVGQVNLKRRSGEDSIHNQDRAYFRLRGRFIDSQVEGGWTGPAPALDITSSRWT